MATIPELLRTARVIAVVGLSSDEMRPSHGVAAYMQRAGYRIIPVNPNETEVLGEKAYARLEDVPEKIDIVDVFRRSDLRPRRGRIGDPRWSQSRLDAGRRGRRRSREAGASRRPGRRDGPLHSERSPVFETLMRRPEALLQIVQHAQDARHQRDDEQRGQNEQHDRKQHLDSRLRDRGFRAQPAARAQRIRVNSSAPATGWCRNARSG